MHVLWILNGCGLEGGSITGGPVRFHEVSRRWTERGVAQSLLTTSGGETMLRAMGCSLNAAIVPASLFLRREPFRFFRLWSYIVSSLFWRRAAVRNGYLGDGARPDAVITVSDYFCDIIPAVKIKKATGCKWTAWIHHKETPPASRPGNRFVNTVTYRMQEWSFRQIAKYADSARVYCTEAGDQARERLISFGMDPAKIEVMKCGVDAGLIGSVREPAGKEFDAAMIGIRPNKGIFDIIPVWSRVVAALPSATLCLMGGMSGEEGVLAEIKARGLDRNIKVFRPDGGYLPPEAYYARIKGAKILFAPSHEEGWGIAVCEAMAAGLPVVAYDLPVYRRIYGDSFARIPCFDAQAFAERIIKVLTDRKEMDEYRGRGLLCAAQYDWQRIAEEDLEAIRRQ